MRNSAKFLFLLVAIAMLTLAAPVAKAEIDYQDDGNYNPCFDLNYTGSDCYKMNGPTITACEARAGRGQYCRTCKRSYSTDGKQYLGYQTCAYVTSNAQCQCEGALTDNCTTKGSCTYIN